MSAADRIASGVKKHLCAFKATASARDLIEEALRRGYELDRSLRPPPLARPASKPDRDRRRVMPRVDDHSPRARLDPAANLCGVDLILECERAASRRNPRHRDPKRWSKTAWRRYLYTAAHATEPVGLGAHLRAIEPVPKSPPATNGRWAFYWGSDRNRSIGGSCPLECRDHRGTTTPSLPDRERTELNHRATTKCSRLSIQALDIVA
jgi:hypothetical protein